MARKATATVEVPVLSETATAAFDVYQLQSDVKSAADARSRKAKSAKEAHERVVLGELGTRVDGRLPDGRRGTLAQLADGRRVVIAREERSQAAQAARQYGWWILAETSPGRS